MDNSSSTIIGKDVIESLTIGMYEDARFIYREYVQNAADQIDKAVELGILSFRADGIIEIDIDAKNRIITIEDNATGVKRNEILAVLRNIARSNKDRRKDKGFRGIGRLGGLGYCDTLTFETSYKGENFKSVMIWNAKMLKEILYDRSEKEEASKVIDDVTRAIEWEEDTEKHYFRVILQNVNNDNLLNKTVIKDYLEMVAPVPYGRSFIFKDEIKEKTKELKKSIDEYNLYVNNDQLYKPYTRRLYEFKGHERAEYDEISNIKFFKAENNRHETLAWGWYSISKFEKQIPGKPNPASGIRLRKGNIQIGSERCIVKLHKEPRGNFYFFGEVHAVHEELIPNARRDYFLENQTTTELENALKNLFVKDLYPLYHFASKVRSEKRKIDRFNDFQVDYEKRREKALFTSVEQKEKAEDELLKLRDKAEKAEQKLERYKKAVNEPDAAVKKDVFASITGENKNEISINPILPVITDEKPKLITDDLKLTRNEKKLLNRVLSIIDNALSPDLANNLKELIKDELKG